VPLPGAAAVPAPRSAGAAKIVKRNFPRARVWATEEGNAKARRGEFGELTATRHVGPGGCRWIDQKSKSKNDDAQHERSSGSLSPDCGVVLNRGRTISPFTRPPERGIA
jgi:hypothetical protein